MIALLDNGKRSWFHFFINPSGKKSPIASLKPESNDTNYDYYDFGLLSHLGAPGALQMISNIKQMIRGKW